MYFQAVFFILVRPLSKRMYKRINKVIVELLWLELIWLSDWWAAIKVCDNYFIANYSFSIRSSLIASFT